MYDNFKVANYDKALLSPELYARHLSRLFSGEVVDGLTVVPATGLNVTLKPGNTFVRYGAANVASARLVSLVDDFNLSVDAPDASNPRIDAVVVYVDNSVSLPSGTPTNANLDGPGVAKAKLVKGAPNANPQVPNATAIQASVGAGNPYVVVSTVQVDKGVSVIASGKIKDVRNIVGRQPDVLALGVTSDRVIPGSSTQLTFDEVYSDLSSGTALTMNSGSVRVSDSVRAVSLHLKVYVSGDSGTGVVRFYVKKNNETVSEYYFSSGGYHFNHFYMEVPYLPVSNGDTLGVNFMQTAGGSVRTGKTHTVFTVRSMR